MMETNTEPLKTIRDFIRYCTTRLYSSEATFNHGYQNPEEEAAFLVLRTLRIPLEYEEKFLDAALTGNERETVLNNISRRCDDLEPTAYITKEWWLTGFPFYVDERVLIPRSYIAELIEKNFDGLLPDPARIHSILDMCTGSGCLAILLAEKFPQAEVDAVGTLTLAVADVGGKVPGAVAAGLGCALAGGVDQLVQMAAAGVAVAKGAFYDDLRLGKFIRRPAGTQTERVQLGSQLAHFLTSEFHNKSLYLP